MVAHAQTDVWIDTDPSLGLTFHDADDGFALVQAFHSPELRIRGISVSYGNTTLGKALPIARTLAERFGEPAGVGTGSVVAGATGPTDLSRATEATEALEKLLASFVGDGRRLTYLALGPLTDLASLLQRRPDLAPALERVVFLGGRTPGERFRLPGSWNRYEFHDANFEKDPAAATLVLRAGVPLTLVPVSLAFRDELLIRSADFAALRRDGGEAARFLCDAAAGWLRGWRYGFNARGGPLFDSLAVLAITHPRLCTFAPRRVIVSQQLDAPVSATPSSGDLKGYYLLMLADDVAPIVGPPPSAVTVCTTVSESARATILERLSRRAQ